MTTRASLGMASRYPFPLTMSLNNQIRVSPDFTEAWLPDEDSRHSPPKRCRRLRRTILLDWWVAGA